jgi:hypothetical protein
MLGATTDRMTTLARCAAVARDGARSVGRSRCVAESAQPCSRVFVDDGRVPHAVEHIPEDCGPVSHGGDATETNKGSVDVRRSKSKLSFLFESAATTETIGRYSFVGAGWLST